MFPHVSCKLKWLQAEAVTVMNQFLSGLYRQGVFIPPEKGEELASKGLLFLKRYSELARLCYDRKKKRFAFTPKGHYLHHQILTLFDEASQGKWGMNLLVFACQLQEDFVGRPSRLARRVSSRTTSLRVIQRVFLAIRNCVDDDDEGNQEDEKS